MRSISDCIQMLEDPNAWIRADADYLWKVEGTGYDLPVSMGALEREAHSVAVIAEHKARVIRENDRELLVGETIQNPRIGERFIGQLPGGCTKP